MSLSTGIRIARTTGAVLFALGLDAAFRSNSAVVLFIPSLKHQQWALAVSGLGIILIAFSAILFVRSRKQK